MLKLLGRIVEELVPLVWRQSAEDYAASTLTSEEHKSRTEALRVAARGVADEARLKEFRDVALAKHGEEANRQASIISRAQGLFVALALFGVLFAFGTSLLTATSDLVEQFINIYLAFVIIILTQITLIVINVTRAIGGIEYPAVGSSDLTEWLTMPNTADFYRAQALLTLDHYRKAALNNNWRFHQLTNALKALRNIVFALSALILFVFSIGVEMRSEAPLSTNAQVIVPYHQWHWPDCYLEAFP